MMIYSSVPLLAIPMLYAVAFLKLSILYDFVYNASGSRHRLKKTLCFIAVII